DPNAIAYLERLKPPGLAHPFGTDENGRDVWARVVYGARPTLTAAVALIGLSLVVGSLAGLVIGASGRRTDEALIPVFVVVLAFNVLGERLRDVLDPTSQLHVRA